MRLRYASGVSQGEKRSGNVWRYPTGYNHTTKEMYLFDHPAMFPEKLAARCIRTWSKVGDVVLDPFAGSGTTLAMAKRLGRKPLGIEVSAEYVKLIERRLADVGHDLFGDALATP